MASRVVIEVALENLGAFDKLAASAVRSARRISDAWGRVLSRQPGRGRQALGIDWRQTRAEIANLMKASQQLAQSLQGVGAPLKVNLIRDLSNLESSFHKAFLKADTFDERVRLTEQTLLQLRGILRTLGGEIPGVFDTAAFQQLEQSISRELGTLESAQEYLAEQARLARMSGTAYRLLARTANRLGVSLSDLTIVLTSLAGATSIVVPGMIRLAGILIRVVSGGVRLLIRALRTLVSIMSAVISVTLKLGNALVKGLSTAARIATAPLLRLYRALRHLITGSDGAEQGFGSFMRRFMRFRSVLMGVQIGFNLLTTNIQGLIFSLMFLNYGIAKISVATAALVISLGSAVKMIRTYGVELEDLRLRMANLYDSVRTGEKATQVLEQWAISLGVKVGEIAEAVEKLGHSGLLTTRNLKAVAAIAMGAGLKFSQAADLFTRAVGFEKPNVEVLRQIGIYFNEAALSSDRLTAAQQIAGAIMARYGRSIERWRDSLRGLAGRIREAGRSILRHLIEPISQAVASPFLRWLAGVMSKAAAYAKALWKTTEIQRAWRVTLAQLQATLREYAPEIEQVKKALILLVKFGIYWLIISVRLANRLLRWFLLLWRQAGHLFGWVSGKFKGLVQHIRLLAQAVKEWLLTGNIQPLKKFFIDLWNEFARAHPELAKAIVRLKNAVLRFVPALFEAGKELAIGFIGGFIAGLAGGRGDLEQSIVSILNSIAGLMERFSAYVEQHPETFRNFGAKVGYFLGRSIRYGIDMFVTLLSEIFQPAKVELAKQLDELTKVFLADLGVDVTNYPSPFQKVADWLTNLNVSESFGRIRGAAIRVWNALMAVVSAIEWVQEKIVVAAPYVRILARTFGDLVGVLYHFASFPFDATIGLMGAALGTLKAVYGLLTADTGKVQAGFEQLGGSLKRVFTSLISDVGGAVMRSLALLLDFSAMVARLFTGPESKLPDQIEGIRDFLMENWSGFEDWINNFPQDLGSIGDLGVSELVSNILTKVEADEIRNLLIEAGRGIGKGIIAGFVDYITQFNPISWVADFLKGAVIAMKDSLQNIGKSIASEIISGFNLLWNDFKGIPKLFKPIVPPSPGVTQHATGFSGWVASPRLMLVGEKGPEYVQVTPAYRRPSGGSVTINITVNVTGSSEDVARRIAEEVGRQITALRPIVAMI